jgi:sulfhydrogenase subunit gamma (sulfur reductase)
MTAVSGILRPELEPCVLPFPATIESVTALTPRERLFRLRPEHPLVFHPSQFVMLTLLGIGEAPISICSDPARGGTFELCVRRVGTVTTALHALGAGDPVWIRGPFGNGVPIASLRGLDLVLLAGGLGLAPLRPLVFWILAHRGDFGRVSLLYGTRTPEDVLFRGDLAEWAGAIDVRCSADRATAGYSGRVGPVTGLIPDLELAPLRTAAVVIGPPVMYRFALRELCARGMAERRIFLSLERRMRCGIGKCGHCQVNGALVCQDGPVFSYRDVKRLPEAI